MFVTQSAAINRTADLSVELRNGALQEGKTKSGNEKERREDIVPPGQSNVRVAKLIRRGITSGLRNSAAPDGLN